LVVSREKSTTEYQAPQSRPLVLTFYLLQNGLAIDESMNR